MTAMPGPRPLVRGRARTGTPARLVPRRNRPRGSGSWRSPGWCWRRCTYGARTVRSSGGWRRPAWNPSGTGCRGACGSRRTRRWQGAATGRVGRRPTGAGRRPTGARQRPTRTDRRPTRARQRPTRPPRRPTRTGQKPTEPSRRPTGVRQRPTRRSRRPTGAGRRLTRSGRRPTGVGHGPTPAAGRPTRSGRKPIGPSRRPTGHSRRPTGHSRRLVVRAGRWPGASPAQVRGRRRPVRSVGRAQPGPRPPPCPVPRRPLPHPRPHPEPPGQEAASPSSSRPIGVVGPCGCGVPWSMGGRVVESPPRRSARCPWGRRGDGWGAWSWWVRPGTGSGASSGSSWSGMPRRSPGGCGARPTGRRPHRCWIRPCGPWGWAPSP